MLEALYYLSCLSSHRVSTDAPLVRTGAEAARISATIVNEGRELTPGLTINPGRANKATVNGAPRRSAREILGIASVVLFSPEDLRLVRGEPADRRRLLDELVALRSPRLAAARADYDKVLRQRSALLKTAAAALRRGGDGGRTVLDTLDVWDGQLAAHGAQVVAGRLDVVTDLAPHAARSYAEIAPHSRPAALRHVPRLSVDVVPAEGERADTEFIEAALLTDLAAARDREIDRGTSLVGPHRDDLDLVLGDDPAKSFASHGESWSFALALRLGSIELVREQGREPILLLDDVFAELDARRREHLATLAAGSEQVIVSAAVAADVPPVLTHRMLTVEMNPETRLSRVIA